MDFDPKPIGIGNLTNLKRKARKFLGKEEDADLKQLPQEDVFQKSAKRQGQGGQPQSTDEGVAQLAVDVVETHEMLYIIAPLAGVDPEEVRVEITEDVVIIEGEREYPLPALEKDDLLVQECYFGLFSRSIVLPEAVDSKRAKAEFKKNVLIISLPKLDNVRTRIIKVDGKR